jgi:hypothetical protein
MAPYEGDTAKSNVNQLKFFKIAEDALRNPVKWATDVMMQVMVAQNISLD